MPGVPFAAPALTVADLWGDESDDDEPPARPFPPPVQPTPPAIPDRTRPPPATHRPEQLPSTEDLWGSDDEEESPARQIAKQMGWESSRKEEISGTRRLGLGSNGSTSNETPPPVPPKPYNDPPATVCQSHPSPPASITGIASSSSVLSSSASFTFRPLDLRRSSSPAPSVAVSVARSEGGKSGTNHCVRTLISQSQSTILRERM